MGCEKCGIVSTRAEATWAKISLYSMEIGTVIYCTKSSSVNYKVQTSFLSVRGQFAVSLRIFRLLHSLGNISENFMEFLFFLHSTKLQEIVT